MVLEDYARVQTNCLLRNDLKKLATANDIEFSKALEFGVRFLLAEKGEADYPDNKLLNNITKLQGVVEELSNSTVEAGDL